MSGNKKICPIMSSGAETKYCDESCKLYVSYLDKEKAKSIYECALVLIAESITHKDLY